MSIPNMTNDLAIVQKLSDLPNATEGLTPDLFKAKFDEGPLAIQKWINDVLIPKLRAEFIPYTPTTEIDARTIEEAIRAVHGQIRDAATGTIVNGSVTKEKLAAELLERAYGGRPWVSLDTPGPDQNLEADFPIGQIWLRPAFTVVNAATGNWVTSGCNVAAEENKITVTGDNTVVTATATQAATGIGQNGDRVYVLFDIQNKDSEITALTLSLNSGEEQDVSAGVYESTLVGSTLTVQFSATWPSTSLAGGSFEIVNYTVVNVDQILRQTKDAAEIADWAAYLKTLLPLSGYVSPEEAFIHVLDGVWWSMVKKVAPVERGGTGMDNIGIGEMLVGGGDNTMERLATPNQDESFLQFHGGRPVWRNRDDTIATLGALRIATGSYTGNGGSKTLTLPVTPKLLHISSPSGAKLDSNSTWGGSLWCDRPVTIGQGCSDNEQYTVSVNNGHTYRTANVSLSGNKVDLSGPYLCNRNGVVYNWVAIY